MNHRRALFALLLTVCGTTLAQPPASPIAAPPGLPLQHTAGPWDAGHVQGIAVDQRNGYLYYSFTNLLAKYDFNGALVGTLVGWNGHLGDLDFNPDDGKVYGSLEYKKDQAFYIAIIDVQRIDRVGVNAADNDIVRTVYLPEVVNDYTADINGDGRFDGDDGRYRGNEASSPDHRYGCSGIDGVSFGPRFGHTGGTPLLTVAYGIYGNTERSDNDHQVLLQYDVSQWQALARPLLEAQPHHSGPAEVDGKYFVYTGNTSYGVQNLSYDPAGKRWLMGVYQGKKPDFPNYLMFAVDAQAAPVRGDLRGVAATDARAWEQGLLLPLADAGLVDKATGIRGWQQKADVGLQALGGGLFYLVDNYREGPQQAAKLRLVRWNDDVRQPFVDVTSH